MISRISAYGGVVRKGNWEKGRYELEDKAYADENLAAMADRKITMSDGTIL